MVKSKHKHERIGVYGGTFDPPHRTHIDIAHAAREYARLDRVLFIVSAQPPHKRNEVWASAEDRVALVKSAIANEPGLEVSRAELKRSGPSYTVDTLRSLEKEYAGAKFFLVVGQDSLHDLPKWRDPEGILERARLLVVPRPGEHARPVPPGLEGHYDFIPFKPSEVSSTTIRERLADGKAIDDLVPEGVAGEIGRRHLYIEDIRIPRYEDFLGLLRERLPHRKLEHVLSVTRYLASFAESLGLEREQAITAGLLHDICRKMKKELLLEQAKRYGITPSPLQKQKPSLLHGPVAAEEARRQHGVDDPAVYEAIYWHTTGKPGYGLLGQALYLADFAEPLRPYPEAAETRERLRQDGFAHALRYVADRKVNFLRNKFTPDPIALEFLEWLENETAP